MQSPYYYKDHTTCNWKHLDAAVPNLNWLTFVRTQTPEKPRVESDEGRLRVAVGGLEVNLGTSDNKM